MNRNRFEFLELGEEGEQPPQAPNPAAEGEERLLGGRDPIAERGADGEPLAQVRVEDTRGYQNFLAQQQDADAIETLRNRLRVTPGTLRAVEVFGERGPGAGQFNAPAGLAVDGSGILFVADSYNHRVSRITPDGGVSPLGGRGSGRGQFLSPQGVATDAVNAFYIVEQGNHRVQKYAEDGTLQLVFGRLGVREGEMRGPTGIAVAPLSGCIYVADAGNGRVQKFDPGGHFLAAFVAPGTTFSPQAVAVDREENVYIADPFTGRIWRFDALGRPAGSMMAQFHHPRALACGTEGLVYVADAGQEASAGLDADAHGRVLALHGAQSHVLATVEDAGRRLGGLARPGGLAVAPPAGPNRRGDLYVADTRNHRILRFLWE
jgi:DNA-binding beta-propeller fold protein YncE